MVLVSSQASFSQYLDSDPEFEDALLNIIIPGDLESPGAPLTVPTTSTDDMLVTSSSDATTEVPQEVMQSSCKDDNNPRKRASEADDEDGDDDSDDEIEAHLRRKRVKLESSSQPQPSSSQRVYSHPSLWGPSIPNTPEAKQEASVSPTVNRPTATSSRTLTSADGATFIENFYQKSRLHHLSTWKAELKALVREVAKRDFVSGPGTVHREIQPTSSESVKSNSSTPSLPSVDPKKFLGLTDKQPRRFRQDKIIFHADFDCFFASVGILDRPHLRDKPVGVCHSQTVPSDGIRDEISESDLWEGKQGGKKASMSEVASVNYVARAFGIKNGMLLQKARSLCPQLITIPYEFDKYKRISLQLYGILLKYADNLEAVSVDEALLDVTSSVEKIKAGRSDMGIDFANELALKVRKEVKEATGCDVSIGIGHNVLLARIATRFAKPATSGFPADAGVDPARMDKSPSSSTAKIPPLHSGTFYLRPSYLHTLISSLPLTTLPGVGRAIASKAADKLNGATTVGDIMKYSKTELCTALGQAAGEGVYWGARGMEREERKLVGVLSGADVEGSVKGEGARKSVSAEINYGIRFQDIEQVKSFMEDLGAEVSRRLKEVRVRGRTLTLKVLTRAPGAPVETPKFLGSGHCVTTSKQTSLPGATNSAEFISTQAWGILKGLNLDPKELRGIGIQITKLESVDGVSNAGEMVQKTLGFERVESKGKVGEKIGEEEGPVIHVQPPSSDVDIVVDNRQTTPKCEGTLDLPSFSQVDEEVLSALPEDVRKELDDEYNRRSATPTGTVSPSSSEHDKEVIPPLTEGISPGVSPKKQTPGSSTRKTTDRGTPLSRITQALQPRNRTSISPYKSKLFSKRNVVTDGAEGSSSGSTVGAVKVSDAELNKLGIDAEVFRALPRELQSEQLARARFSRSFGEEGGSGGKGKGRKA